MKLKEVGALAIRYSGIPLLVRHVVAGAQASIVVYHDPAPEVVERHLDYLSRRYRFIPLGELVEAIRSRDWGRIPRRSLVITLDDGHAGNAALAPVFRKYGVRPTIFLCSQIVATRRRFWFHVGDGSLKRLPNAARLRRLGEEHGFAPEREYPNASREALSAADLASLGEWADIGSHTRFHPILTTCDDDECEEEIARSRREIEQATGRACLHFAFPNGDYTAREIDMVRRAGYRSARTIDVGWNGVGTDPFRLRITGLTDDASVNLVAAQLSGVTMYLKYLLRGSFSGQSPKITPTPP